MNNWINRIEENTKDFRREFGVLSEEELNWKPAKNSWSIAQNIQHIILINESYFPLVKRIRENKQTLPWFGRYSFVTSFLGKAVLQAVQPERKRKMKTFSIWEPEKNTFSGDILMRFTLHQEELKSFILDNQDLVEQEAVISSPAKKNIVYPLSTAFELIVTHERRHFNQAKEVLALMKK